MKTQYSSGHYTGLAQMLAASIPRFSADQDATTRRNMVRKAVQSFILSSGEPLDQYELYSLTCRVLAQDFGLNDGLTPKPPKAGDSRQSPNQT